MRGYQFCAIYGLLWLVAGRVSTGWFVTAAYAMSICLSVYGAVLMAREGAR